VHLERRRVRHPGAHQLLLHHRVEAEVVDAGAAVPLRHADAEQALLARLRPDRAVDLALLADRLPPRDDLAPHELGDRLAEEVVLVVEDRSPGHAQSIRWPPSTFSVWPVIQSASSEARKRTARPMSTGCPCRFRGRLSIRFAFAVPGSAPAVASRRANVPSIISVSVEPGQMQLTRTCGAYSSARLRQPDERELGGDVGAHARLTLPAGHRGDVHDRAPLPLDHAGEAGLRHQVDGVQVDVDRAVPELVLELEEQVPARRAGHAGVVDQDVHAAEALGHLGDDRADHAGIGEVPLDDGRPRAERVALLEWPWIGVPGARVDGDVGPRARQLLNDAAPYPAPSASAGDECYAAAKRACACRAHGAKAMACRAAGGRASRRCAGVFPSSGGRAPCQSAVPADGCRSGTSPCQPVRRTSTSVGGVISVAGSRRRVTRSE
jgi:hypothetical protein